METRRWRGKNDIKMPKSLPSATKSSIADEIEKIAQRIMAELETASSKDLTDTHYAKTILQLSGIHYTKGILHEIESASSGAECAAEKKAVIKVLLLSIWLQRLYFIIRAFLMGIVGAVISFGFVLYFGTIDITLTILMGIIIFVSSLIITRFFDAQIIKVTKSIVRRLSSHRIIRDFIMNHF